MHLSVHNLIFSIFLEKMKISETRFLRAVMSFLRLIVFLATMKLSVWCSYREMKSYTFSFVRASDLWSYMESGLISSGLIEKILKYSEQYISGGTFENVVLHGGWSYKEWSYSETGLYLLFFPLYSGGVLYALAHLPPPPPFVLYYYI